MYDIKLKYRYVVKFQYTFVKYEELLHTQFFNLSYYYFLPYISY